MALLTAAVVTVCSMSIPRTAPSMEWVGRSEVDRLMVLHMTGLVVDTS